MSGANNIAVHVVADTAQYNAAMTEAGAQAQKFGQTVNQAGAAQAAIAGERELAAQTRTTAQAWVQARMAMIGAQERANTVLRAGRKADVASASAALDELDARHDAFLAASRAYYEGLTEAQQASYAAQETAANKEIEAEYQRAAARLETTAAVSADTDAEDVNTAAITFNAQAQREASYAVGELATARYGRLETTMLSLGARTGILRSLMSPLGISILGASAAAIGLGVAAAEGAHRESELNDALLVTGNAAGLTTDQLRSMASTIAGGDITIGNAQDAILALAQSGKVSGQDFRDAAQAVVDFADLTGEKTTEAAAYVERLANATTSELIKANEQYHFLSVSQFKNIEDLRREGKTAEATKAIMEDFYGAMASREKEAVQQQGYLLRGIHGIERAFSDALHTAESIGVPDTVDQKIAKLKRHLGELQSGGAGGFASAAGYAVGPDYSKQEAAIEAQIGALERLKAKEEAVAKAKAAANHATDNAIAKAAATHAAGGGTNYGAEQHQEALKQVGQASQQAADQEISDDSRVLSSMQRVQNMSAESANRVLQIRVSAADQALNAAVSAGQMSAAQREAIETRLTNALYAQDMKRLQDELATAAQGTTAYQQVADQIEQLEAQHYQRLSALDAQYQQAKKRQEQQSLMDRRREIQSVESMENQMLSGLLSGRMTFAAEERRIFQQVAAAEIEAVMHSVTESLMLHQTASIKTLAIKAETGLASIESDAAQAAAGAYKAMVGIPYVGPIIAPAAAAVAFAAVGAYKAMVSFDVGAWNIPQDVTARVHAGEMILPRPYAEDARRNGFIGGAQGGGGGDTFHVHAMDPVSFQDFLSRNPEAMAAGMRSMARSGMRP